MIQLTPADIEFVTNVVLYTAKVLPPQFNRDDLIQQGIVAALQAALAYDPMMAGGASWRTFARYRIKGAVLMAARRRHWREAWHLPLSDIDEGATFNGEVMGNLYDWEPMGDYIGALADAKAGPLDQFIQSQLRAQILRAVSELPNPERFVFRRRQLDGATPCRVAKQVHWPLMRVLAVEASARSMLRQVLTLRGVTPGTVCHA